MDFDGIVVWASGFLAGIICMCRCVYASSSSLNEMFSQKYLDLLSVMYADKRKYENALYLFFNVKH